MSRLLLKDYEFFTDSVEKINIQQGAMHIYYYYFKGKWV